MHSNSNNILLFVLLILIIICIVAYDNYISKIEINKLQYILNNTKSQNQLEKSQNSQNSLQNAPEIPRQNSSEIPRQNSSEIPRQNSPIPRQNILTPNELSNTSQFNQYYTMIPPSFPQLSPPPPPPLSLLKEYDYRAYADPLTPPFKRDDHMIPAQAFYPTGFDYYTRGEPGMFKKVGYLKNLNETNQRYEFLTLMGRQKYNGSTQYEYYVTSTNSEQNLKFYLDGYKKELYDGDSVYVSQLKSNFEVFIDKNLDFEYNSRIF
jgi:hypothetical protein